MSDARIIYATQTLEVVMAQDADVIACKREVLSVVREDGEDLELTDEETEELSAERSWFAQNREKILMGISGFMLAMGLALEFIMHKGANANVCYVISAVAGLAFVTPAAFASLRRGRADMNVLMGIAVIGALIMGFTGDESVFMDAAIVIFLDQVGEWLEGWSMRKTSGSIEELMELAPNVAHVVSPDGSTIDVMTNGVGVGYTVRVKPGERVPLDGRIVAGSSSFNEAPVTGESLPKDKGVGAEVFAGSLNTTSVVDVEVTAPENSSTLARIVSQVQGAQAAKAPYENFVNRFAAGYTPIVIVGALILGIVIPGVLSIVHGFDLGVWHDWAYRACSLLVVACPCALVISTPVSFVSALSCAAHEGLLVKGGAYFDIATHVTHVTFDKTGTLTEGKPSVSAIAIADGASVGEEYVLAMAASLESRSTHPVARAIVEAAGERRLSLSGVTGAEEVAANGLRGNVGGRPCVVGKLSYVQELAAVSDELVTKAHELADEGASIVVVALDGIACAVIAVADAPRASAAPCIGAITSSRPHREVEMLTGDGAGAARAVAATMGISCVSAELLPADKLARIEELQGSGEVVCMVGDGINDAPALAQADLGITMGAAASDTALEVADVALLADSLESFPFFFALSKKTMNVVRENITFAIGVKVGVFVLVSLGLAGMGAAVFADTGVALLVVLNGMRLMKRSRLSF